ncbi:tyrosine-type recombinase/integrase [Paucibacter sp. B51]|uniref:tyrosine-type recombinase/integrase n=1 Tax=Paucibacter sp. B51 TaxID=2993315 RepID=UPI0022EBC1AF|nr:tyrosine-type recombinase/integrase [Paucibacter sp. B51]
MILALPIASDHFAQALRTLPPLPRIIQYEDDYDERIRSIHVEDAENFAELHLSGKPTKLNFSKFAPRTRPLLRSFLLISLQTLSPASVQNYYKNLIRIDGDDVELLALSRPMDAKASWPVMLAKYSEEIAFVLKALVAFLCQARIGQWTPLHADFVRKALAVPKGRDAYASVRAGDCFLSTDEEARLVRWIDDAARSPSEMNKADLEIACLVICSYQMGMRPKQLGILRKRDCSVRWSDVDGSPIVHLQFRMLKQRDALMSRLPLVRKVKREWASLFAALWSLKSSDRDDSFLFGFTSRSTLSAALIDKLDEILPAGGRVAYDLRHSLAQRLVDSGASHEELAAAMGHSELRTGLVYFRASANQAELVNKALGVSETYRTVARIATERFIDKCELAKLRGDQQIAGVPHGIPISGIGGCKSGQPSCSFNPVIACYGCPKFMPVRDLALHEQVLQDFRSIVLFYKDVGHGEVASPAFLQLQRTISEVQGVIRALGAE